MNFAQRAVRAVDERQQRQPWLAFPVAVWKKFSDDQAGHLAALIAYYTFVSMFPLLLVLVTVLEIVLARDPALRQRVLDSAFAQFPVVGPQLRSNVRSLRQTGPALAAGIVLTLLGSLGAANAAQHALNGVWGVPLARRPRFPWSQLRSLALVVVVGLGLIATTLLSGLAAGAGAVLMGTAGEAAAAAVSLLLNIGVFWLGFRLAIASTVTGREMFPGALLAGISWQALQLLGAVLIGRQIAHASPVYGVFAMVLGLLAWLYLQAQFTLYAMEAAVVRARGLWPRSLAPPLTPQDQRALALHASAARRGPERETEARADESAQQSGTTRRGG